MNFEEAKKLLADYGQEHLLAYYNELSVEEQADLLGQISMIDFSVLKLAEDKNHGVKKGKIEPLPGTYTLDMVAKEKDELEEIGLEAIRQCKVAAVLLAGGQGTRLGSDKPKGMYNIGLTKGVYIFEMIVRNLMQVVEKSGAWVPLLVMTSVKNHEDTTGFFKEHNYFGYNAEYVRFFIQDMAPSTDYNGKIYMEGKAKISMSPNGNGGWFSSLMRSGLLNEIKRMGVEWLNVFAVDNVLQKMADPVFVGGTIRSGYPSGAKVVGKAAPDEKVGVMCKEDGMPSIVEYYELTEEMMYQKNPDGTPAYHYGVILNYLFAIESLEKIANAKMPLHIVEKKIPYMDTDGNMVKPESPNGYKFETLILDMIHMMDNCFSFEVDRRKEFAPIKNPTGVDSVESARELLMENGIQL
ncbi:MAG: UDPGP type 1 family protein [Lachnospiraceae bacterium]|nr:UDPGP type 1 family protein [Lachnospiraceae bacterium]